VTTVNLSWKLRAQKAEARSRRAERLLLIAVNLLVHPERDSRKCVSCKLNDEIEIFLADSPKAESREEEKSK